MTITCGVLGYPPPTIIWSKTNGTLSNRASMSISTTTFVGSSRLPYVRRNLTFTNSYREDTGMYQCRANNSAGIDTRSFNITVPYCPSGLRYHTCNWQLTCSNLTVRGVCDQMPACSSGCFCSGHTVLINGVCSNASLCSVYLPNITDPLDSSTTVIAEGDAMTITCGVLGYPPPTIIWSKTNGAISNRASMSISTTTFVGSSRLPYVRRNLTFTNSYREDAGSYQCRANNSAGIDTRSFIITVQFVPEILSDIVDSTDEGRDLATFACQATGEPVPTISWYFNDIMINVSDTSKYMIMSTSINTTTTENTLTVYNVTSSDVGTYTCNATNTLGSDISHGCLAGMDYRTCGYQVSCDDLSSANNCTNVTCESGCFCSNGNVLEDSVCIHPGTCPMPPTFTNSLDNITSTIATIEGGYIVLTCGAIGYPPPTIIWSKANGVLSDRMTVNDSVIVPTGYGNVSSVSVNLTLTNAYREDTGLYQCTANNSVGNDTGNISITVQFVPEILSEIVDLSGERRDVANFTCRATGEPVPEISWHFKGTIIDELDTSKYMIMSQLINTTTTESTLTVYNVTIADMDAYTCDAASMIGIDLSHGCITGMEYHSCGVHVTCHHLTSVDNCTSINCTNGCFCANGNVLDGGYCIHPAICPVPPIITGPLENTIINTTEEDTITITCEALGYPPPTIVWSKTNGALNEPVPMSGSVSVPTGNGNVTSVSANFTMTNANREDTGSYKCTASNIVDTNERDVGIIVQYIPSIRAPPENTPAVTVEGNTITITCEAVGYPPPTTEWNRTDGLLSYRASMNDSADISFGNATVSVTLTLTNARRKDTGLYQCITNNFIGTDARNISITVQFSPEILIAIIDSTDEGRDLVTFTCQATSEPVPTISWYFNDAIINVSDTSKYIIMPTSINTTTTDNTLTVYNLTSSDVGTYTCNATNTLGSDTSHVCLAGMEYRLCGWHTSCDTLRSVMSCRNSTCVSGCFCTDDRVLDGGFCIHPQYCPISPNITDPSEDYSTIIDELESRTFPCEALGYPPPTIEWSKTDGALSDRVSMSDSVSVPIGYGNVTSVRRTLTITRADINDMGEYECTANNSVASTSRFFTLSVHGVVCNNITVPEDSVISNCTSGLLGFGREGDQCIIRHYNYSELRTCQQGRNWTSTTIPSIEANARQILVLDGDEVNLRCTPSSPDISITWLFNGVIISDGRISLSPPNLNHMMTISSSTVSDNGVYKCQFVTTVFQLIISREINLTVNEACDSEYSGGIVWPRRQANNLVRIRCSALHSSFRSGVYITRMCYSNGEWGGVNMSACTMRLDANPLVLVETNSEVDATMLTNQITNILEDNNYNIVTADPRIPQPSNILEVLVTISDNTIAGNIRDVILENLAYQVSHITVFLPSYQCSCNESIPVNNSVNHICIGPSVRPCIINGEGFQCNEPTYAGNGERCGLDSDSDGYPDVQLDCTYTIPNTSCERDACTFIYSPGNNNTDELCTAHEELGNECSTNNDSTWNIEWPSTPVGDTAFQKCPGLSESAGLASRQCLEGSVWSEYINTSNCSNVELVMLNDRAGQLQDILRSTTSSDTMDLTVSFEIDEVQQVSEELTMLTSTSEGRLVPNDINTTNEALSTLISITSITSSSENAENDTVEDLEPVIQNITTTIDNLLSSSNEHSFEAAREEELSVGEDLLENTENFAIAVGNLLNTSISTNSTNQFVENRTITIERENINISAQFPPDEEELIRDIVFPEVGDTQVTIPAIAIIYQRSIQRINVPVVNFIANNLQRYLDDGPQSGDSSSNRSLIISSQISNGYIELPDNGTVKLKFDKFVNSGSKCINLKCAYWNFSLTNKNNKTIGGWASDGIKQDTTPGLPVECNATHLTSFAVLVGAQEPASLPLRIVSNVGCCISMVCLFITITTIIYQRKKIFKGKVYKVHLNLSIALLMALLLFVGGVETATANTVSCVFVTLLLHYFFLAVFSWALCEGIMVYTMFAAPFYKGIFQRMSFYLLVGWVLPAPVVVVSAAVSNKHYGLKNQCDETIACWISNKDGALWAFIAPMVLIILVNCFFLAVSVYNIYKVKKYGQQMTGAQQSNFELARTVLISILTLMPLLGGTWILGLFFVIDSESDVLQWIFTLLNTLQGVTIFFFHILRNREVVKYLQHIWKRMTAKKSDKTYKDTLRSNIIMKSTSKSQSTGGKSDDILDLAFSTRELDEMDWTYSEWEKDFPDPMNTELQHADWMYVEGAKSTENPLFTTAEGGDGDFNKILKMLEKANADDTVDTLF
ncbi:uncharacterized protein [Dysidea avara]